MAPVPEVMVEGVAPTSFCGKKQGTSTEIKPSPPKKGEHILRDVRCVWIYALY